MPIAQSYLRFLVAIEIRVTTQIMLSLHCYELFDSRNELQ